MVLAALKLYEAASIVTESDDPKLLPQMQFMSQVAPLLAVLVKACAAQGPDHDYSLTSLPQTRRLLDRHSQDADTEGPENSHVRSWPSVSEGSVCPSMMREAWPKPIAAAWLQKSTMALKALST